MTTTHELDERRRLADEIIAASGRMPSAERHRQWLLGLDLKGLRARLAQVRAEGWRTPGPRWMARATQKAGIPERKPSENREMMPQTFEI